jgi:hypothetical protein
MVSAVAAVAVMSATAAAAVAVAAAAAAEAGVARMLVPPGACKIRIKKTRFFVIKSLMFDNRYM